jgi:hypothetical protein
VIWTKRDLVKRFGTVLIVANALVAFLTLTNLFLIAAGAIQVDVPDADDLDYDYDTDSSVLKVETAFTVQNKGIYAVKHLDISSRLTTSSGFELVSYDSRDLRVDAGETRTFPVTIDIPLDMLVDEEMIRLLVEDTTFVLKVKVRALYTMGLTQFRSDEIMEYPWKAPLAFLGELMSEGSLMEVLETALGWAGPIVREHVSTAVIDSAFATGEWRTQEVGEWATLNHRLWFDNETGDGAFDMDLVGSASGFEWHINGSVPLRLVDGVLYLGEGVIPDGG